VGVLFDEVRDGAAGVKLVWIWIWRLGIAELIDSVRSNLKVLLGAMSASSNLRKRYILLLAIHSD
jgi:hypothetical protein